MPGVGIVLRAAAVRYITNKVALDGPKLTKTSRAVGNYRTLVTPYRTNWSTIFIKNYPTHRHPTPSHPTRSRRHPRSHRHPRRSLQHQRAHKQATGYWITTSGGK